MILEYWDIGILIYWSIGMLEYWYIELFRYGNILKLKYSDIDIFWYWNIQILKYSGIEISNKWVSFSNAMILWKWDHLIWFAHGYSFSSWQYFRGLLRKGIKLAIHDIVENFIRCFEALKNIRADILNIDENGNVEVILSEDNEYILQSFTLRASRKRLRRLKDIEAYNVGQCLSLILKYQSTNGRTCHQN